MRRWRWTSAVMVSGITGLMAVGTGQAEPAAPPSTPEAVVRQAVLANERCDLEGIAQLFLKDPDIVSFGIGGLKFVGWTQLEKILQREFQAVSRVEIAIKDLKVWAHGEVAWFVMELDYTRVLPDPIQEKRMLLKLRETGVLEKRDGRWLFHSWHESTR